jgi:acyl carrier protein
MTIVRLTEQTAKLKKGGSLASQICAYIARHAEMDTGTVDLDTHFGNDLGLDWLDVVELMILVEEQFAQGKIADDPHEIVFVRDLIHHIQPSAVSGIATI